MMKNKEEYEIFNWYPELCEYGLLTKEECDEPIAWYGIECGRGWYQIIREVLYHIDEYCDEVNILDDIRVAQIKEKFGGLRIYINYNNNTIEHYNTIERFISKGVAKAYKTCEVCGRPAKMRRGGYLQTLCWICNFKRWYNGTFSNYRR